jgi:predicted phage terminase large subunit-like protein
VAGQVWGRFNADYYLLDVVKKRLDITQSIQHVTSLFEKWKHNYKVHTIAEDKANGSAIKQILQSHHSIIMINPKDSKEQRAIAVTHLFQSKNIYLPRHHQLLRDFEGEVLTFPRATHDDQVDAMTQALSHLKSRHRTSNAFWGVVK